MPCGCGKKGTPAAPRVVSKSTTRQTAALPPRRPQKIAAYRRAK